MYSSIIYPWMFFASVLLSWIVGYTLTHKWPGGNALSMSGHGASNKKAYLLFGTTLTVTSVITYAFFTRWFIPEFSMPDAFRLIVTIFAVLQVATAWFPDTTKMKRKIHRFTAYSLAVLMPVELAFILAASEISIIAKVISAIVLSLMLVSIFGLMFVKNWMRHFLLFQAVYVAGCQLSILAAVVVRK